MKIPYIGTSALVFFLISILGCGRYLDRAGKKSASGEPSSIAKSEVKSDVSAEANKPQEQVALAPPCEPPKGVSNDPQNINDVILLLNAMPKPVTIPCYLQVLKRPLRANATASILSVQPAADENNPRIFLFSGPSLIQSFVPMESSSKAIEFSFLLDDVTSIKGEITFPVTKELDSSYAYTSILSTKSGGTTCASCHGVETKYFEAFGLNAFASRAIKPFKTRDVPLTNLEARVKACGNTATYDCDVIRALYLNGKPVPKNFPEAMKTLF
jgi:hypothetical protein